MFDGIKRWLSTIFRPGTSGPESGSHAPEKSQHRENTPRPVKTSEIPKSITVPSSSGTPADYRITGRIRDENNLVVEGYTVQAFDEDTGLYFHPDDRLGRSGTDNDGAFEITFNKDVFADWFEGDPEVYLVIRDRDGKILISTPSKKNTTGDMDFQIKLGKSEINPFEPDIYAGNFERMIAALRNVADIEDISKNDIKIVLELLLRTLNSWTIYRDDLVKLSGYDGIQVPEYPRKKEHDHITRWDRVVLPE